MKKLSRRTKNILNILFLLVLIAITLGVLIASYAELNFRNIWEFVTASNLWLLLAAFACMILGIVCEGMSLFLISRKLGHRGRVVSSLAYSSADIYYSAITPSASGGQPASAYYMIKDGMGAGTATFTLVFNVVAYSAAFLVLAATAFAVRPALFAGFGFWVKFFILLGIVVQTFLVLFFAACMYFHGAVLKFGNLLITLFTKMKIVKNDGKWRKKLFDEVQKYAACRRQIKKHPLLFFAALLLNVAQRFVRVLISCFVCLAADPETPFMTVFAMQSFLIVGYTSLPLPGGVGAFEYLYLQIYSGVYDRAFLLSAMMVTRVISYYLSIVVSGAFTLSYHVSVMKRKPSDRIEDLSVGAGAVAQDAKTEQEPKAMQSANSSENMGKTSAPLKLLANEEEVSAERMEDEPVDRSSDGTTKERVNYEDYK